VAKQKNNTETRTVAGGREKQPSTEVLQAEADALHDRLQAVPTSGADWQRLGLTLAQLARHQEALEAFQKALEFGAPARLQARAQALALSALERGNEAVAVVEPIQKRFPKDFEWANLLGVLYKRAGRLDDAIRLLDQARKINPKLPAAWQNLGNVYEQQGKPAAALKAFQGALRLAPLSAELWTRQGITLTKLGQLEAARDSLSQALNLQPHSIAALEAMSLIAQRLKRADEAKEVLERLLALRPGDSELVVSVARLQWRSGQVETAKATLVELLREQPGHLTANLLLARIHGDGDRRAANEAYRRAVTFHPESWAAAEAYIDSLSRSRYDSEAVHLEEAYAAACELQQKHPEQWMHTARALRTVFVRMLDLPRFQATGSLNNLLPHWINLGRHSLVHYELGQVQSIEDRLELLRWHRDWGRRVASSVRPAERIPAPAFRPERKLRIGFMSSDLRDHPVSYFALPLLEGYDRDKTEVFCYSFYEGARTRVQAHIEGNVTGFRWWPQKPDDQVANDIAADNLDMLFELGGSTAMNKLEVMAYRPARLGASWLGYPHSAGIEAIDYILVDPYIEPSDSRLLIEKPFKMPETWVALSRLGFQPITIDPQLPEERRGYLSFGTANNPYKFTVPCIDAWAAVLRRVPNSRFVFLRPEAATKSFIINAQRLFAERDVDPARIEFIGMRGAHMQHYNAIDIALDSMPHVGGTTTCESLWMGVPTVSLVGQGFPERLSYSNLVNAGVGDLAVFSLDAYVEKAAALAEDRARRRQLRYGLRDLIAQNPLGQTKRFVHEFYQLAAEVSKL
jgi:predicted O-linked N-acetylglucosamine transferase (SPINDLY family)